MRLALREIEALRSEHTPAFPQVSPLNAEVFHPVGSLFGHFVILTHDAEQPLFLQRYGQLHPYFARQMVEACPGKGERIPSRANGNPECCPWRRDGFERFDCTR